jgi:ribosomal protein S18 acetylase RimI-like enzyme
MAFDIRPYHPSDLYALYQICLRTGASGADASALYHDPELLGHYYAAPYAVFEPDLCFVLTREGAPCGYILGARDTAAFGERCEREWFPVLRARYPLPAPDDQSPDAQIIRSFHAGRKASNSFPSYPAHLHIDILPEGQGQGRGRALMHTFLDRLRELGIPGVHLGVGTANRGAVEFYRRVGFEPIEVHETWIAFGMRLG